MALRITFRAAVDYENESQPLSTYRAEVVAPNARSAASRALLGARQHFSGSRPKSIVLVLEEISRGTVPGKKPPMVRKA